MSGWPRSSRVWRRAHRPRVKAIGPTDGRRRWQAKREHPHRQADTPASRKIRRPGRSAPDKYGTDRRDWRGSFQKKTTKTPKKTLKVFLREFFPKRSCSFLFRPIAWRWIFFESRVV